MNILSIGNSFSQDAQRYLHRIAKAAGEELTTVNLYIGGCSLYRHYINMLEDRKSYGLEINGEGTGFYVSIKEALVNRQWDVVTLQQASIESVDYDRYSPYIQELAAYIRKYCPKTKLMVHQTWAYERDSERLIQKLGYVDQALMYTDLKEAYQKSKESIQADGIIPSGTLLQNMLKAGFETVHRDGCHLGLGAPRYAVALLWYRILTGNDIMDNSFKDFDVPVSQQEIKLVKNCVIETLS